MLPLLIPVGVIVGAAVLDSATSEEKTLSEKHERSEAYLAKKYPDMLEEAKRKR